jgi:hypothetical protein
MQVTTAFATAGAALAAAALAFTLRRACTGTADRAAELRACILLHLVASTATAVACGTFASGAQSWQSSDGNTVALTAGFALAAVATLLHVVACAALLTLAADCCSPGAGRVRAVICSGARDEQHAQLLYCHHTPSCVPLPC